MLKSVKSLPTDCRQSECKVLSSEDYLISWVTYLVGAVGLMAVWWFITRKIRQKLIRDVLRLTAATLLLVPFPVINQEQFWAPAFGMSLLEAIFGQSEGFSRAGIPVIIIWFFVMGFYLLTDLLWQRYRRKRQAAKAEHEELMRDHDEMVSDSKTL